MIKPLNIVIDTREQAPWAFDPSDVVTEVHGLGAGDYALLEDCEKVKGRKTLAVRFAIERKSLDDYIGTISGGWDRFQRELVRMENFPARVVIIESDFDKCCFIETEQGIEPPDHNHHRLTPSFIKRRTAELTMQGVCVLFCGNAELAAGMALRIFKRRADRCQI